jgi:hypothetical protein
MNSLPTPTVFDMNNAPYVESLLFLGILPVIYLLLVMIILMIYYCCVRFSKKNNDEKPGCCSAAVGFYITSGKESRFKPKKLNENLKKLIFFNPEIFKNLKKTAT